MFAFGIRPRRLAGLLASCAVAALAGCANSKSTAQYAAVAPAAVAASEIEDDGLPAQSPPPAGIRELPDDPNEPFSPNYGDPHPPAADRYEHYEQLPPAASPPDAPAPVPSTPATTFRNKVAEAHDAH